MLNLPRKHLRIGERVRLRPPKAVAVVMLRGVLSRSLVCLGVLCLGAPGHAEEADRSVQKTKVTAVRFWSLGDVTRVAIETTAEFRFRYDHLDNPERIFFDLIDTKPPNAARRVQVIRVGDRLVQQIRVAETQHGVTRVVLDLAESVDFTTSQLANPDRLIIELHSRKDAGNVLGKNLHNDSGIDSRIDSKNDTRKDIIETRTQPEPKQFRPPDPIPQPRRIEVRQTDLVADVPSARDVVTRDLPAEALTRRDPLANLYARKTPPETAAPVGLPAKRSSKNESMIRALGLKVGRIVLDAGHGGHDVGSIGPNGLLEKDLVLDITRRLGALIEERLGSEVIYTRSDDTFVPLEQRTAIANLKRADLFLSIHANSSSLTNISGVETYYLNFTTSKSAMEVAARENASSQQTVFELQDILKKIALHDKVDESREFALRLQRSLYTISSKTSETARDRGVKKAPFVVLIGASMPSVLAEIGFVSNARDESLMRKPEHRQRIAEALYKGLASYANTLSHFQMAQRGTE